MQIPVIRILLLDDHSVVGKGIAAALASDSGFAIVGSFSTSRDFMAALNSNEVDLVVIDYSLGADDADGLSLVRMMRRRYPDIKILVLSSHDNPLTVSLSIAAGAHGFLGKTEDITLLAGVIRRLMRGEAYTPPALANSTDKMSEASGTDNLIASQVCLSAREHEVILCCLEGMSIIQIAKKYSRSRKTVSTQKLSAYRKLGIKTDIELFKINGLLIGSNKQ
ncbi:response regulator containing a CheY-like receiver domain and an HTH DNA-binding domain [Herbaspirillum sp. CF444]|uniref:response regulator transcription factor n=1 Tax=Herbaspirillum sp. CF444 TaxID=1144319 RepID=UPI00027257CE|nr:response regulator transcription factor [Herbaspirillum sp. CF444]EJL88094.1 response regulator containing a CheY-like receiver domain and an HTH DNA-binding domain [Herbaspirillum sp. CF444]